jgi:predicted metalloprotease
MEWEGQRESENVENRGGWSGKGMAVGGGSIGAVLLGLALYFVFGIDPGALFQGNQDGQQGGPPAQVTPEEKERQRFVSVVLASTEDVWTDQFRKHTNKEYRKPKLVLFHGKVESACGLASAAVGPFYCPGDEHVYLDLEFFAELRQRFNAPGEFAEAYVIAHEIGHHVQKQLGYPKNTSATQFETKNQKSVRLELQADFLAGVWGHYAKDQFQLNQSDLVSALTAANAIGDDRLQSQAKGHVVPDSFTHGSSAQRVKWFRLGFDTGELDRMADLFQLPYGQL